MSQFIIGDVEETILEQLRQLAAAHGRTPELEAKIIIQEALHVWRETQWAEMDAIRTKLAASGRAFSDSVDLVREDRGR